MPNRTPDRYSPGFEPPAGFEARRQRAIDALTQAYASDRITVEEYEARAAAAAAADRPEELEDLVSDLPAPRPSQDAARRGPAPEAPFAPRRPSPPPRPYAPSYPAYGSGEGTVSVACVMGDRRMTGNWLDSDRVNSFTLMGSTRLDLRDADLPESGPVRIEAFTLMGETVIVVPRELPVRLTAVPFMGEAVARRDVDQNVRGARRWVEISGLVVMGSVVVKAAD
ncbi:MAG TPA: DUF1707 domain-containing protein [Spirochaetia bacterium]|nr:DUF1707 domain-containing protein [Spirochaetia bacterium]